LRLWLVNEKEADNNLDGTPALALQLQHLQTGKTWRFTSLAELNQLFNTALSSKSGLGSLLDTTEDPEELDQNLKNSGMDAE
jgi:hypothetical protein